MPITFKHHDTLRLFVEAAQYSSFTDAAHALNMTKGAISYQIKTLETDLGAMLFDRNARGVKLTKTGQRLFAACRSLYREIEEELAALKGPDARTLTVGMSSYFASRWLSPRLMTFMQEHPDIQLRIQPMTELFDLERQQVDIAIRWGDGTWNDVEITPFMPMSAWPVGNKEAAEKVHQLGAARAFSELTLLRDHDASTAWSEWFDLTGLPQDTRKDTLIIPDPNVRVQAVIDGQGVALNDDLVAQEIAAGKLVRLSDAELTSYGYFLAIPRTRNRSDSVDSFIAWLQQ
jgi:DNA-binding transcriptional LysR family regulator